MPTGFSAVPVVEEGDRLAGVARVAGPSWSRLPSLTVGLFGVQMLWSVEMSYASPYLLSLGLSKSLMAIVFLAGPLSGLVMQPVIGILADNSKSRFGRRRPFILVCAALCAVATLLLGFTRPFAAVFSTSDAVTVWLAILAIYGIDFTINAALDRALLVDVLPTAKQPAGNAWAARMLAVGSVAGFFVGNLDLPRFFPLLGAVQLQVLSILAALLLFSTQLWVCLCVQERVLLRSAHGPKGLAQELKVLWETLRTLPSVIRQICWIQFFAWLGWFPVLFYATVYIGDLHKHASPAPETDAAAIALDDESTRLGSRALFYSALVSLAANVVMPFVVVTQRAPHAASPLEPTPRTTWSERVRMHLASLWASSHLVFATCMAATFVTSTVSGATVIISVTGFCWAITQWAPFALLGEAILSHSAPDDAGSIHLVDTRSTRVVRTRDDVELNADGEETRALFGAEAEEEEEGKEGDPADDAPPGPRSRTTSLESDGQEARPRLGHARTRGAGRADVVPAPGGLGAQAGAIIGIHNMFVVVPQFLVTGLASAIFAVVDPGTSALQRHVGGDGPARTGPSSIAIVFRLGGVAALVAFVLAYRLARQLERH